MSDLPPFRYSRPRRLHEALAALARPGACIYAGGTDLLVALMERRPWARFVREVVDIKQLDAACGVRGRGTTLRIGALTTAAELAEHPAVGRHAPALAEAARLTAAPALRRRATLGGNLSTPLHSGDVATALLALGAVVEVADRRAVRVLPLADFLVVQAAEWPRQRLILGVRVARAPRSAFEKIAARAGFGRALVAVAVVAVGRRLQVALGGVSARPLVATATAAAVQRGDGVAAALDADCRTAGAAVEAHRLQWAEVLIARARARVGA